MLNGQNLPKTSSQPHSAENTTLIARLHQAAANGDIEQFDHLVSKYQLNPAEKDDEGRNALHQAALNGHIALVDHLISQYQLDPAEKNKWGANALHLAAQRGHPTLVDHLISKHQLNPAEKNKWGANALHLAAQRGHLTLVDHLISQYQLDPAEKDNLGQNALHCAALGGHIAMADHLISQHQLDPAEKDHFGRNALHHVAYNGHLALVDHLISKYQLNPTEKDNGGGNALHYAAANGHLTLVDHLISQYQLDPAEKDNSGRNALYLAALNGHIATINYLLQHYSFNLNELTNPSLKNKEITTLVQNSLELLNNLKKHDFEQAKNCLDLIPEQNRRMILNWLLEGKRPLTYCLEANNADLVTLLLCHGAPTNDLELEVDNETEATITFSLGLMRQWHLTGCSEQDNPLLMLEQDGVLNRLLEACQKPGPYQHVDRQIVAESLLTSNLLSGPERTLNSIRCATSKTPSISEQQEIANNRLAIELLDLNVEFFPNNLTLVQRLMESYAGLGGGFEGKFNDPSSLGLALSAIESLREEKQNLKQNNKQLKREIERLKAALCEKMPSAETLGFSGKFTGIKRKKEKETDIKEKEKEYNISVKRKKNG